MFSNNFRWWRVAAIRGCVAVMFGAGVGCQPDTATVDAAIAKARSECGPVKDDLGKVKQALEQARNELTSLKVDLSEARTENAQLKQTARFYFDQAVARMAASSTDDGDNAAIVAFQVVMNRFPHDPLEAAAQAKISDLTLRIAGRARTLANSQAEVRKLIQTCKSNSRQGHRTSGEGLVFNEFNQLNLNAALGASSRARPYEKKAQAAKESAEELLKKVPDPDGKLKEQVEHCDDDDN